MPTFVDIVEDLEALIFSFGISSEDFGGDLELSWSKFNFKRKEWLSRMGAVSLVCYMYSLIIASSTILILIFFNFLIIMMY